MDGRRNAHFFNPLTGMPSSPMLTDPGFSDDRAAGPGYNQGVSLYSPGDEACKGLIGKLLHFEYHFRFLGEGGPLITSFRGLRKGLEQLLQKATDASGSILPPSEILDELPSGPLDNEHTLPAILSSLDKSLGNAISSFEGFVDLFYDRNLVDALRGLQEKLKEASIQNLWTHLETNSVLSDVYGQLVDIRLATSVFIDDGIPLIRSAQEQEASNYLTMTTIATFFSAVTATTLQFSYATNGTKAENAVNILWLSSLVFSVSSAISSLLARSWRLSFVRSPVRHLHPLVSKWLTNGPMTFLVLSGAAFIVGLCIFTFSSKQCYLATILVTLFTSVHFAGLLFLSALFIHELWLFRQSGPVGKALTQNYLSLSLIDSLVSLKLSSLQNQRQPLSDLEANKALDEKESPTPVQVPVTHVDGFAPAPSLTNNFPQVPKYLTPYAVPNLPSQPPAVSMAKPGQNRPGQTKRR